MVAPEAQSQEQAVEPAVEPAQVPQTDYSALEAQTAELAPGLTLSSLPESYKQARKEMGQTSQEFADYKKSMAWATDFEQQIQSDPGLEKHIRDYYTDNETQAPREVQTATNPLARDVHDLKTHIQSMEMNKTLDNLQNKYPDHMNDDMRNKVFQEVAATSNQDVEGIFWRLKGPEIAATSGQQAASQTAEAMARNNDAALPRTPGTVQTKPTDIGAMDKGEWGDALDDHLKDAFSKTE